MVSILFVCPYLWRCFIHRIVLKFANGVQLNALGANQVMYSRNQKKRGMGYIETDEGESYIHEQLSLGVRENVL